MIADDLERALVGCVLELKRLRRALLPQYAGKIAEPDEKVIERGKSALRAAAAARGVKA